MYDFLRRRFLSGDPEEVHDRILERLETIQRNAIGRFWLSRLGGRVPDQPRQVLGLRVRHPIGMAAGFDKDARVLQALQRFGFSFVEVGTVTPRPQPGNPKPRVWRFPEQRALVNALGFPGDGMDAVGERLRRVRSATPSLRIPIGVNVGKNKDTSEETAVDDYRAVISCLRDVGDYFVINVSSPNTPGLRNLQERESLTRLLQSIQEEMHRGSVKPLLVKIAPDLERQELIDIVRVVRDTNLDGIVAANTTTRRDLIPEAASLDRGGLSGPPLYPRTREIVRLLRGELRSEQALIAVGGVSSPEHVDELLELGADLIQLYTAFIFLGPRCVRHLLPSS